MLNKSDLSVYVLDSGDFHDQSHHGALLRRNSTQEFSPSEDQEFSPSEEIPPPYEQVVLKTGMNTPICSDLVNALSTLQQSEPGMFDGNSYTVDDRNTEKNGFDKATEITKDISWEIGKLESVWIFMLARRRV